MDGWSVRGRPSSYAEAWFTHLKLTVILLNNTIFLVSLSESVRVTITHQLLVLPHIKRSFNSHLSDSGDRANSWAVRACSPDNMTLVTDVGDEMY